MNQLEVRDGLTFYPGQILGYRSDGRPIRAIAGGAPDDDDDSDGDVDLGDDGDGDGDDDGDDLNPDDDLDPDPAPAKKILPKPGPPKPADKGPDKPDAYTAALNRERLARKAAQRDLAALKAKNETDQEKLVREANEAAEKKYKPVAVRSAAIAALTEAKVKGGAARALRLLDMSVIDVDDDGDIFGLDEQVTILQSEYPELFTGDDDTQPARRRVPKPGGGDTAPKPPKDKKPMSSAEKIAFAIENGKPVGV